MTADGAWAAVSFHSGDLGARRPHKRFKSSAGIRDGICPFRAIVWRLSYRAAPLQTIYMEGNFCKALKGVSSPLKVHRVQWKIESNQPVKIEIPHLLHDLIWFEVASFGSPSNKMNCLFFQECCLHLCLLFSASSSSFCGLRLSGSWLWKLPNHSLAFATINKRKAVLIASLLFMSGTSLSILFFCILLSLSFIISSLPPRVLWGLAEEPFLNQRWINNFRVLYAVWARVWCAQNRGEFREVHV